MGGANTGSGSVQSLTQEHADYLQSQLSDIEAAAPMISSNGAQVVFGNMNWSTSVEGIDNRYLLARNWSIQNGREFTEQEINAAGKVAIIGATVQKELFGDSDPVGQSIRIGKFNATIIATLKPKGQDTRGRDQDDVILMPLKTVRTRLTGVNSANPSSVQSIFIKAYDKIDTKALEDDIASNLRSRMKVAPNAEDPFMLRNLSEMVETRAETTRIFNGLLAAVASVSLVVGGIGIMNIMLVSVTERTREIGLRMALGATPSNILNQFLVESVVLCGLGGIIGISLALMVILTLDKVVGTPAVMQPTIALISILFSALIGVFFGYYPARKASGLQPIDALRYE
jgi:putative ABC transport system permease protein